MPQQSLALQTDFYQLTMSAAYFRYGMNGEATFSLFAHGLPACRNFMVAAGLEYCLDYLHNFSFSQEDIDYLRSLGSFSDDFLDYLSELHFSGEVWAVPEGSVVFGGEPLLEITAPLIEAQLAETLLINKLNLHSTLASKAARCTLAAGDALCVDFSLRRTQGLNAGLAAARSSAIAGFKGTSNVAAAKKLGLKPVGTMAHAFVEAFGDEVSAFRAFGNVFPDGCVLLVDTYDSMEGLLNAVQVARELSERGHQLVGIRLDSGDLAAMSLKAREVLDAAGLRNAKVVVSGNLDEYRIDALMQAGAAVDMLGIGTRMGSSADHPYLDLTYKLVCYEGRPTLKLSTGKETWAAPKQVFRRYDQEGHILGDTLALREESMPGKPLLEKVMENGNRLEAPKCWRDAAEIFSRESETIPPSLKLLEGADILRPTPSDELQKVQALARKMALKHTMK